MERGFLPSMQESNEERARHRVVGQGLCVWRGRLRRSTLRHASPSSPTREGSAYQAKLQSMKRKPSQNDKQGKSKGAYAGGSGAVQRCRDLGAYLGRGERGGSRRHRLDDEKRERGRVGGRGRGRVRKRYRQEKVRGATPLPSLHRSRPRLLHFVALAQGPTASRTHNKHHVWYCQCDGKVGRPWRAGVEL
jgi:hypothetical protein